MHQDPLLCTQKSTERVAVAFFSHHGKKDSLSLSLTKSPSSATKHTGGHVTQLRQCKVSALLETKLRGITPLPSGLLSIKKERFRTHRPASPAAEHRGNYVKRMVQRKYLLQFPVS